MPTIIEARRRLFRFARGAAVVLAVWFVGMAAAALVVTPSAVVAFGDPSRLVGVEGDLLASDRTVGTDTVKSLYSGGAWLV
jgi:hypothetical protein